MDGKFFLDSARLLKCKGTHEADYRSAISRAYYACFLTARTIAFANCSPNARHAAGKTREKDIRHMDLRTYFKENPNTDIKNLGDDLAGLCGNRVNADYVMSRSVSAGDANDAINEADALLEAISNFQESEIGNAMEQYIHRVSARGS